MLLYSILSLLIALFFLIKILFTCSQSFFSHFFYLILGKQFLKCLFYQQYLIIFYRLVFLEKPILIINF